MTRFYYGAISPLTVEQYTVRELSEYVMQMQRAQAEQDRA